MLTCITCAKQTDDRGDGGGVRSNGTPNTRDSVKGITAQIKDMASKFSGAYKQCKPCTSSDDFKKGERRYMDYDTSSEGGRYSYIQPASSSSTPAWDFPSYTHSRGLRSHSRFAGAYNGDKARGERVSVAASDLVIEDADEPKEWMAQVEPGVHITFVSLPNGGNDLKRIRFSRDMFNKWQAQRWWGENYDRIMELYNVQRFNRQALQTPARSDEPRDSTYTRVGSVMESPMTNKEWIPRNFYQPPGNKPYYPTDPSEQGYPTGASGYPMGAPKDSPYMEPSRTTTSSRDDVSVSNASELETEWVEQDEPGVYITIRQLADGSRELRRVRFSREKFGEVNAKSWWEQNRERIQAQYL
ncbi:hypothetical protein RND81_06G211800 [Saponaria officinalis]|uniref:BRX domain-containing protein n=1 Tax=Saponaria officinalis TaxID=3572 RepID=A0AAW1K8Y7_SAPOF